MTTLTDPQQASAERRPSTRASDDGTRPVVDTVCQLCTAAGCEQLLDLGQAPLVVTVGTADGDREPDCRRLRLVRCLHCSTLQRADALDGAARHSIATAVGDRSFAGRPDLARRFCEDAIDRWGLRGDGHVIEVGSGTGSLLRFFRAWQLPVLGVEADDQLSRYARLRRIPTWRASFDTVVARRIAGAGRHADLLIVSAPVGAFADFRTLLTDAASVLRRGGVMTLEVPDALRIIGRTRFDEVAHAQPVVATVGQLRRAILEVGLELIDVERAEVDDARLRLWIQRPPGGVVGDRELADPAACGPVRTRLRAEAAAGVDTAATAWAFARRTDLVREQIVNLIEDARTQHCTVAGNGAGPTAVTLANTVGLNRQDVAYIVDPDPARCAMRVPGTDIPVISPEQASAWRPDLVLALSALDPPPPWDGVPVYSVVDLIDVVHRLTGATPAG